jgi:Protein of unknown function (DUF3592)
MSSHGDKPLPTLYAVVTTDFVSLLAALLAPVALALGILVAFKVPFPPSSRLLSDDELTPLDQRAALFFLAAAPALALVGLLVVALRVRVIRRAFRGTRVAGVITSVRPFKDRAYLGYRWSIAGTDYDVTRLVHLNARTRSLRAGQPVTVAVDPEKTRAGWLVEAFIPDE